MGDGRRDRRGAGRLSPDTGELTFEPGDTSGEVSVEVVGDESPELLETFTVQLSTPVGAVIEDGTGLCSITDDDTVATVSVGDGAVVEGNEGTTPAEVVVSLSEASEQAVSVSWTTADGSAIGDSDYVPASGIVDVAPGELTKSVSVLVSGDTTYEGQETFLVNIASSDVPVTDPQGSITITNDDPVPSIAVSDVTVTEGTGAPTIATFVVSLSAPSGLPASVAYQTVDGGAKAPGDYQAASGTTTFVAGQTTATIAITSLATRHGNASSTSRCRSAFRWAQRSQTRAGAARSKTTTSSGLRAPRMSGPAWRSL